MFRGGMVLLIRFYRRAISPFLGNRCRFYPSCSHYALEAFSELSFYKATLKTAFRLLRCGPWSKGGVDFLNPQQYKNKEYL